MVIRARCPAKVNLFLAVGPKDARGYHPLRTVFQAIGLYDEVTLAESSLPTTIECDWPGLPPQNTLTKALRLAGEYVTLPSFRIELSKRIPSESGLGGGSSDAAGLLRALQRFTGGALTDRAAHEIAAAVGADVPFFLVGGRARGEGYGERLTPLPDPAAQWLVVARPDVGVSTPEAYRLLDGEPREWAPFAEGEPVLANDFERVAPQACLDVLDRLREVGAEGALLAGSGSACFGVFGTEGLARAASQQLKSDPTLRTWVAPTLTREESLWTL